MNEERYLTIKQFVDKYPFISKNGIYRLMRVDSGFVDRCVRKFGGKILLLEHRVKEYIENSKRS